MGFAPRSVVEDDKTWFPIEDIVGYKLTNTKGKLATGVSSWLKRNLPEGSVKKFAFTKSVNRRAGKALCVDSDNVRIVGMYARHIESGGDFRAKWADLPDTPVFDKDSRWELSWRNAYRWSRQDHFRNTGLDYRNVQEMRNTLREYENIFQKKVDCSYKEAKEALKCKEV